MLNVPIPINLRVIDCTAPTTAFPGRLATLYGLTVGDVVSQTGFSNLHLLLSPRPPAAS